MAYVINGVGSLIHKRGCICIKLNLNNLKWCHQFICRVIFFLNFLKAFVSSLAELECEAMRQENARLQNIVDNQKYSVADIERINHEKMSCNRPLIN